MAVTELDARCSNCKSFFRARATRDFLGFQNLLCPHCEHKVLVPLTSGYRITYWVVLLAMTPMMVAVGKAFFNALAEGQLLVPNLSGVLLLLLYVGVIVALIKNARIKRSVAVVPDWREQQPVRLNRVDRRDADRLTDTQGRSEVADDRSYDAEALVQSVGKGLREERAARGHTNLGAAYSSQGRIDEAIEEFEAALKIQPGFEPARRGLEAAMAKRREADLSITERAESKASRAGPGKAPKEGQRPQGEPVARADRAEKSGKPDPVESIDPRDVETLALALTDSESEEDRAKAAIALGLLAVELGDERAIAPLIGALGDPAKDVRFYATKYLGEIGKPAVESLVEALAHDDWCVRAQAANALGLTGDPRAVKPLERLMKEARDVDIAHGVTIAGQLALHQMEDRAIELDEQGREYAARGALDAAINAFEQAVSITPNNAELWNNLGTAHASRGDLERAIREFEEAVRINPNLATTHSNLGTAYASQGRIEQAIAEFRAALENDPDSPKARRGLEACLAKRRRSEM